MAPEILRNSRPFTLCSLLMYQRKVFHNALQDLKWLRTHLVPLLAYFAQNNLCLWLRTWLLAVLKVSELHYVGLWSDFPARTCTFVLYDWNRGKKGWYFINRRIEPRTKMVYLSSVLVDKIERIDVRKMWKFGIKISKDWEQIRLLTCFTKWLSGNQNWPSRVCHFSERTFVFCFLFAPSNCWTFGKISKKFYTNVT
jgi:hypothetical protein